AHVYLRHAADDCHPYRPALASPGGRAIPATQLERERARGEPRVRGDSRGRTPSPRATVANRDHRSTHQGTSPRMVTTIATPALDRKNRSQRDPVHEGGDELRVPRRRRGPPHSL